MNTPQGWWKDFFSGLAVDFWRAVITEQRTRAEAGFIQKMLQVASGARLLDAPCGGGRLSLELSARGYQLTGVDIAPDFLTEARANAAERRVPCRFERRDMRELPWQGAFDGASCFGNSFGYFEEEGNQAYLRAVARVLKPGARFLMEAAAAEVVLPIFEDRSWVRAGNILFLEENTYDPAESRLHTEYTFVRDSKVETRTGSQRIYTYRELCHLLEETGFSKTEGYSSLDLEPFKLRSERLCLVTTKKV